MRILMVGAGAVGRVLTRFLEAQKANEVTYYVRAGRRAELGRCKLLDARSGELHVRERPKAVEPSDRLPVVDTAILAVRADQLDSALDVVAQLVGDVRIASASAGMDDVARIRARFPGRPVVQIVPTFFAYPEGDAIKWWNPPLARTLITYEGDEAARPFADELAKDLTASGLATKVLRSVKHARDTLVAAGMPVLVTLELAGWDFDAWAGNAELRGLASAGVREGVGAVAPGLAGRLLALTPKALLSTVLRAAPRVAGKGVTDMWRVHGPKIAGQTRELLDALIARGEDRAASTGSLKELRRRLSER
jgi:hypothetical protein